MKKSNNVRNTHGKDQDIESSKKDVKYPSRVLMKKSFALSLRMPGQSSGAVTRHFSEGQIIHNPDTIKLLLDHDAPAESLN